MASADAKAALKALLDNRAVLEEEMNSIIARLTAPGMPGIKGPLIDEEGFPMAGIDLHGIRADRNRLAVLKTDHTELSEKIEKELKKAFAELNGGGGQPTPPAASEPKRPRLDIVEQMDTTPIAPPPPPPPPQQLQQSRPAAAEAPIGVIDEVAPRSPAADAGLLVDDVIFQLGALSQSKLANAAQLRSQCT